MDLTFEIVAVAAGILTVLSPCILPILPALLSASAAGGVRHRPFWIVLGLAISFTLFGIAFAVFGSFLGLSNEALRNAAMAILLFFGLSLLWPRLWEGVGNRVAALAQKLPGMSAPPSGQGRGSALLVGASLGLVWAPCAGPILGIIITLAAVQGSFGRSLFLLGGYSLGAALPMLVIGYGGRRLYRKVLTLGRWGELSHRLLGVVTIATVAALFFNLDTRLLSRLPGWLFPADRLERRLAAANPGRPGGSPIGTGAGVARTSAQGSPLPVLSNGMPEFAKIAAWLNSPPLSPASLRGKVVLVDFWTYSCINCIRTFPYITRWYDKYKDQGLVIVGVHTPEFAFEKDKGNVEKAIKRYGIRYPVALDNFYGTWDAYRNNAWPAHYLFDAQGRLRETHFGEGNYEKTEEAIQSLLAEAKLLHTPVPLDRAKPNVDFSLIGSPETYVGYRRAENFASPQKVAPERTANYSAPSSLSLNQWALEGTWKVTGEAAVLEAPGGGIRFRFQAPKLNLVMKGEGKGARARVLLDGKPVPAAFRGTDVGSDGKLSVGYSRLYNLVSLPAGERLDHLFEIVFDDPGVEAYAFTFG
jgi:cytochrome c biogenesis protein CcdA/thiol-disulfide isomerase/thioredoxin